MIDYRSAFRTSFKGVRKKMQQQIMKAIFACLVLASIVASVSESGGITLSSDAIDAADKVALEFKRQIGVRPRLVSICVAESTNVPAYCLHFKDHKPVLVHRPWRLVEWYFDLANDQTCVCEKSEQ